MKELKREEFNSVVAKGNDLLIYFYQKNNPKCALTFDSVYEVDQLIAKSFEIYIVDFDSEPEIVHALSIKEVPEIVSIKNSKIHRRATGMVYSNHILDLLK